MKTAVLLSILFLSYFSSAQNSSDIFLQGDVKLSDFIEEKLRMPIRAEIESQLDTCLVTVYAEKNSKPVIKAIRGCKHWDFAAEILLLIKELPAFRDAHGQFDFNVAFTKDTKRQNVLSKKEYLQFEKKSVPLEKDLYLAHYQSICQQSLSTYYIPYCLEQNFTKHPEQFAVRILAKCDGYSLPGEFRAYEYEANESTDLLIKAYQIASPEFADQLLRHKEIILLWRRRSGGNFGEFYWALSYAIPQQYKGGESAIQEYIHENLVYPVGAFNEKREGECVLGFCYEGSGSKPTPHIRIISYDHIDFVMASLRCLSEMNDFDLQTIPSFAYDANHRKIFDPIAEEREKLVPEMIIHFHFDLETTKPPSPALIQQKAEKLEPFYGVYNTKKPYLISQKAGFDNFMVKWYFSFERIQKRNPELVDSKFYFDIQGAIDKYGYFHLDEGQTPESTKVHPDFPGFVRLIQNFGPWIPAEVNGEIGPHFVRFSFQNDGVKSLSPQVEYPTIGFGSILPRFIGNKEEMTKYLVSGLSLACESNNIQEDSIAVRFRVGRDGESSTVMTSFESGLVFFDGFREFQNVWTDKQINGVIVAYDTTLYFGIDTDEIVYRNRTKFCPPKGEKFSRYDKLHGNVAIPPQYFGGQLGLINHVLNNLIWSEEEMTKYGAIKNYTRNGRITLIVDKNGYSDSVEVSLIEKKSYDMVELFQKNKEPDNDQLKLEYERALKEKIRKLFLKLGKWIPGRSKDSAGMPVHTMIEIDFVTPNVMYMERPKVKVYSQLTIKNLLSKPKPYLTLDFPSKTSASNDFDGGSVGMEGTGNSREDKTIYNYHCETPASFGSQGNELPVYLNKSIKEFIALNPGALLQPFRMSIRIDDSGKAFLNYVSQLRTLDYQTNDNKKLAESIVQKMPIWKPAVKDGKTVGVELYLVIEP